MRSFNYVAIPRTASRSIRQSIGIWNNGLNHDPIWKHPKADFNFTFMREPMERAIAWFEFHKTLQKIKDLYPENLEEWAEQGFPTHWTKEDCLNLKIRHGLSQVDYMTIDGENEMNFIGDFAHLKKELTEMCTQYQIKMRPLHHVGKMGHTGVDKLSDSFKSKAHTLLKEDFELYEEIRL